MAVVFALATSLAAPLIFANEILGTYSAQNHRRSALILALALAVTWLLPIAYLVFVFSVLSAVSTTIPQIWRRSHTLTLALCGVTAICATVAMLGAFLVVSMSI